MNYYQLSKTTVWETISDPSDQTEVGCSLRVSKTCDFDNFLILMAIFD